MIKCELCGKVMQTTQGLRGHKTFVHDLHTNQGKQAAMFTHDGWENETSSTVEYERNSTSKLRDRLDELENNILSNTELLKELRRVVNEVQYRLALMATRFQLRRIATTVERLGKRLEEHDRRPSPQDIHEVIRGLPVSPITSLEKCPNSLHLNIQPKDRRFRIRVVG